MTHNMDKKNPTSLHSKNILIAFFSHSGKTRRAAEQIQGILGDDIDVFEIKPVDAYPSDYNACVAQARAECPSGFQPELKEKVKDIQKYDVVFVGTPNWCSTMAPPVLSFLSSHDLSNKTVIPFVTHGGGGMAHCETDIQKACPKSKFGEGGVFLDKSIQNSEAEFKKWVDNVLTLKT